MKHSQSKIFYYTTIIYQIITKKISLGWLNASPLMEVHDSTLFLRFRVVLKSPPIPDFLGLICNFKVIALLNKKY